MKTNPYWFKSLLPVSAVAWTFAFTSLPLSAKPDAGFIVHEWGTFTSVQGQDGALLEWRPVQTAELPSFVHDWKNPGPGRQPAGPVAGGKGSLVTLQRMETPVIYFYAKERQTVSVSVSFPQGMLTEWYPQASQIGPSTVPVAQLVDCAGFVSKDNANTLPGANTPESRARWDNIRIQPPQPALAEAPALPMDKSGSHYFAARETDASELEVNALAPANGAPEHEKFIFYRGVGSFRTPLRVSMDRSGTMILTNEGTVPLAHLFVLGLENRTGSFTCIDHLAPGECRKVESSLKDRILPIETFSRQLSKAVCEALADEGLYPKEASAMLHTWQDSWFAEDGLRVLYILPRSWTDEVLPLNIQPKARQLVRVMVGRAEVLAPEQEDKLAAELAKAGAGDSKAREQAIDDLKRLGRFAEPALRLATQGADPAINRAARDLFQVATSRQ
jgi:hypothetical protein